jgi:NMD protein affecting ribosome stability and mRNA decay
VHKAHLHTASVVYIRFTLKTVLLRHRIVDKAMGVMTAKGGGLDFFFASTGHAAKLVNYLKGAVAATVKTTKRQVSTNGTWTALFWFFFLFKLKTVLLGGAISCCVSP